MTYPMSTKRLLARFDRELKAHVSREKAVAALYRAAAYERLRNR